MRITSLELSGIYDNARASTRSHIYIYILIKAMLSSRIACFRAAKTFATRPRFQRRCNRLFSRRSALRATLFRKCFEKSRSLSALESRLEAGIAPTSGREIRESANPRYRLSRAEMWNKGPRNASLGTSSIPSSSRPPLTLFLSSRI